MIKQPELGSTSETRPVRRISLHQAVSVFLPLAAGYFLSYLFRNANAPIAEELVRDLDTGAASIGLLTSVYFLAFALAQIPIGIALDRFGPRRVQAVLLVAAGCGALLFSAAHGEFNLIVGRFLIGLGTAGCLMSGLKATRQWFPIESLASVNSNFIMFGGLGALAATAPLAALVGAVGWRWTFDVLAAVALLLAFVTYAVVPDAPQSAEDSVPVGGLKELVQHRLFRRFAPMSALCFGAVTAFQGLWAALWFSDVGQLDAHAIAVRLLYMAVGFIVGAPLFGFLARRLQPRLSIASLATRAAVLLVGIETLIALRVPVSDFIIWPLFAAMGAIPVLSYGVLADLFPGSLIARANGLLNVLHTVTAFALQTVIGMVIGIWPRSNGAYPVIAYESAIALVIVLQVVAILSFVSVQKKNPKLV